MTNSIITYILKVKAKAKKFGRVIKTGSAISANCVWILKETEKIYSFYQPQNIYF